jgi:hypothetical protein
LKGISSEIWSRPKAVSFVKNIGLYLLVVQIVAGLEPKGYANRVRIEQRAVSDLDIAV